MATIADTTIPMLSRAEWRAVKIALNDAASFRCASGEPQGLIGRLWSAITGNTPQRPLADGRLEMLRRFVLASRRRPAMAETLAPALEAQGFSRAQLAAVALLSR